MTENKRFSLIEDKQFDGLCLRDNIEKKCIVMISKI